MERKGAKVAKSSEKIIFDIFIPYWGDVKYAQETVDSVLAQTYNDWRLIILDDRYPSREFEKYIRSLNNKKIKYIVNRENLGFSKNYNKAIGLAKSEWTMILGCDDIMRPNLLENAAKVLKKHGQEIAFYQPDANVIDENGEVYLPLPDKIKRRLMPKKSGIYHGESLATNFMAGNWLYFPGIIWKTKVLKKFGFDDKFGILSDLALEMNILKGGDKIYFDRREKTFNYRRHKNSVSSKGLYDGVRWKEEEAYFEAEAKSLGEMGWKKAQRAAKRHLTSRLYAISTLPKAVGQKAKLKPIIKHIIS
jgi:glycosyltransferase involved in cell wall biosynthesis